MQTRARTSTRHNAAHHASSLPSIIYAFLASAIAAIELSYFRIMCMQSYDKATDPNGFAGDMFTWETAFIIIALTVVFTVIAWLIMRFDRRIFRWCFSYRYPIALVLLIVLVIMRVSGTSIGLLTNMLGGDAGDYLGVTRNIRRDEWVVNTPFALAQAQSGFSPTSSLASGGGVDLTLIYAQPCWDISTLFRPFLWGYLVLPVEYGLSFFWCGRLICLFMASFEFGRFITGDNRRLALVYAVLMTFSPMIQWWFAVNSIAEILIFSQLFIMLFGRFLATRRSASMLLLALAMAYLACAFVLTIYPAWQVPVGYIMACLCIAQLVQYLRKKPGGRDILVHAGIFVTAIVIAALIAVYIVLRSQGILNAVSHSQYPGARLETGGGMFDLLFQYAFTLVALVDPTPILPSVCEAASMFGLFPVGIILGIIVLVKKRDGFIIALLIVQAIFLVFGVFGLPAPMAKILLLSNVTIKRLTLGTGIIDIILLVRSIALMASMAPPPRSVKAIPVFAMGLCAIALAAFSVVFSSSTALPVILPVVAGFSICFIALSVFAVLCAFAGCDYKYRMLLCITALVMLFGLMVNPIQIGLSRFYSTPLSTTIEQVKQQEPNDGQDTLWVADTSIIAQACMANGVPTLNSVMLYPHNEIWATIDQEKRYEEIYNRYAHVKIKPTHDEMQFEYEFFDAFTVYLDSKSLKALGITNWVSEEDLTQYSDDIVQYERIGQTGRFGIYKLNYR